MPCWLDSNILIQICLLYAGSLSFKSPLDYIFYLAVINNVAAIFGLAGIINAQRELVQAFFGWNAIQMVSSIGSLLHGNKGSDLWLKRSDGWVLFGVCVLHSAWPQEGVTRMWIDFCSWLESTQNAPQSRLQSANQ